MAQQAGGAAGPDVDEPGMQVAPAGGGRHLEVQRRRPSQDERLRELEVEDGDVGTPRELSPVARTEERPPRIVVERRHRILGVAVQDTCLRPARRALQPARRKVQDQRRAAARRPGIGGAPPLARDLKLHGRSCRSATPAQPGVVPVRRRAQVAADRLLPQGRIGLVVGFLCSRGRPFAAEVVARRQPQTCRRTARRQVVAHLSALEDVPEAAHSEDGGAHPADVAGRRRQRPPSRGLRSGRRPRGVARAGAAAPSAHEPRHRQSVPLHVDTPHPRVGPGPRRPLGHRLELEHPLPVHPLGADLGRRHLRDDAAQGAMPGGRGGPLREPEI